jgi:putative intracellular protease/amidase
MKSTKILIIATSRENLGNSGEKTGIWLEELAAPYYIFKEAGADITLASPIGGLVPLDPKDQSIMVATRNTKRFLKDEGAMNLLFQSVPLEDVSADDFDGVFLTGGHGAMWDIEGNKIGKRLLEAFNNDNKPIGCVGHGAVGLLSLQNEAEEPLIKGKQLTAFSNSEEESAGLTGLYLFVGDATAFIRGIV